MFGQTHFRFMLFETNLVFMLFALMLFGNSPAEFFAFVFFWHLPHIELELGLQ